MEENKENKDQKTVEAEVIKEENSSAGKANKVVEFIKAKKILIGIVLIAIILIIVIVNLIFVSPKEAVKKFVKAFDDADYKAMIDSMDVAGTSVLSKLDEDDYDDFWSEYKDFKDTSDYDDLMDNVDEVLDDKDALEEAEENLKDLEFSMEIDKIEDVKKEASHLYIVEARITMASGDEEYTSTVDFYVMKDGTKSYVIDLVNSSGSSLFSSLTYGF